MDNSRFAIKDRPVEDSILLVLKVVATNQVLLFSKRMKRLKEEERDGLLSNVDYRIELNRLEISWFSFIDDELTDEQINEISRLSSIHLTSKEIIKKFELASFNLMEWRSYFENLPDSHIERTETTQLLSWIDTPLAEKDKSIALLVGVPGSGKSVIMKDLLSTLQKRGTPFLGIKADRYCVESLEALGQKLNINQNIEAIVNDLARTNGQVVILIDQLDALSQSLSTRPEYLETFNQLVNSLTDIPNVRIIISCRIYDLENDHYFAFYKRQKSFTVGKLELQTVNEVLQKLSPKVLNLSSQLLELLRTPLHLDVFCRIYREDSAFDNIKALRDLYDRLWIQKIVDPQLITDKKINSEHCKELVYQLARNIYDYENPSLVAPIRPIQEKFPNELKYLLSEGIIYETKESVTFFHQTFYDFAFAKQYPLNSFSIETYLLKNEQGLHIRACLKMMIEFLHERDFQEFINLYRTILPSQNYFYHIKSLLLSILGYIEIPKQAEYRLFKEVILEDLILFKLFLSTLNSREWFLFLLEEKLFERFIEQKKDVALDKNDIESERYSGRMTSFRDMLWRHLPESEEEVLKFLRSLPKNHLSTWFVQTTLHKIKTWKNPLTLELFNYYRQERDSDLYFDDFMKKAASVNLDWSLAHICNAINKQIKEKQTYYGREIEFEHNLAGLLRDMIEIYPESMFKILLEAKKHDAFKIESSLMDSDSDEIITDSSLNLRKRHRSNRLFELLIDNFRILAEKESPLFAEVFKANYNCSSTTILFIMVEGLRANTKAYINEVYQFLTSFIEREGFEADHRLAWNVRQILKESFHILSKEQQMTVVRLIASIESKYEKRRITEGGDIKWLGYTQFTWLKAIPEFDFDKIPNLKTQIQEMELRFIDFEDSSPFGGAFIGIGAPLEDKEYSSMSLVEWYNSFLQFTKDSILNLPRGKGGLDEHAQRFKKEVEKRPDFFYSLIESLAIDNKVPKEYLVSGLHVLKEVKFSAIRILGILKKINFLELESYPATRLVHLYNYFSNEKIEDEYLISSLKTIAKNHHDPSDEKLRVHVKNDIDESTVLSGHNTARGAAVSYLPYFYYHKKQEQDLFQALEYVAEHDILSVRCQMMPRLALLTNLNKERTLDLFLKLIENNDFATMQNTPWSAQYLARYNFSRMIPYFEKTFIHPKLHENVAIILAQSWIFENNEKAYNLLNQLVLLSDEAKDGAIDTGAYHICDELGNPLEKSIALFARFLNDSTEKVISAYDSAFRHLKPTDFPYIYPTLKTYAESVIARKNPRPFYEYLISCASKFPEDVLDLLENFSQYDKPNISSSSFYDKEPFKVILNVYHGLWNRKFRKTELLKRALHVFDKMLIDDRFRRDADSILDNIER